MGKKKNEYPNGKIDGKKKSERLQRMDEMVRREEAANTQSLPAALWSCCRAWCPSYAFKLLNVKKDFLGCMSLQNFCVNLHSSVVKMC